jgi:hypothetical protein
LPKSPPRKPAAAPMSRTVRMAVVFNVHALSRAYVLLDARTITKSNTKIWSTR